MWFVWQRIITCSVTDHCDRAFAFVGLAMYSSNAIILGSGYVGSTRGRMRFVVEFIFFKFCLLFVQLLCIFL